MDIVSILILLGIAAALVVYSMMPKWRESREAVKRRLEGRKDVDETTQIKEKARATATQKIVKKATPMLSRLIMPLSETDLNQLRLKLMQAGYRQRGAQTVFLASKTIVGVVLGFAGVTLAAAMGYDFRGVLGAMAFLGGVGFLAPGLWLGFMIKGRQDKIRRGLPDVLDLLVVSVESGLALDAACADNFHAVRCAGLELDVDRTEQQGVAQRNQLMGFLRRHDSGDSRDGKHIALGVAVALNQLQGFRTHPHPGLGLGFTQRRSFFADIDHVGATLTVEVGQAIGRCI